MAISKKSTFFIQSSWNLVRIIITWGDYFHHVSWWFDEKCRFFTDGQFLSGCCFFPQPLWQFARHIFENWKKSFVKLDIVDLVVGDWKLSMVDDRGRTGTKISFASWAHNQLVLGSGQLASWTSVRRQNSFVACIMNRTELKATPNLLG